MSKAVQPMFSSRSFMVPSLIGLAKRCLQFLSKNKRHIFHFHQELYRTTCSPFCFTTFCHFSGTFIIPSSKTFYLFEQRTVPGAFYSLPGNWNCFHEENFVKTKINGNPKVQCLMNTADESELPSQAVPVFAWSSKKQAVLLYPDGRLCVFCWLIPDAFHRVPLSVGLIGSSTCCN